MFKKIALSTTAAVMGLTAVPAAADAQYRSGYYSNPGYQTAYRGDHYDRRYEQRRHDQRQYNQRRYSRYNDSRYNGRRCDDGTTGTIIGAIAGGLLGREVAGRRDRTVGTIIGGAVGALAGREIDRGC